MTLVRSQFKGIGDGAHNAPYSPTSGVPRSDVQGAVEKAAGDASGAVSDAATALAAANAAQSDIDTHAARTDNPHGVTAVQVGAQPLDDDLTAIAALSSTGFPVRTASNTWAQRSLANAAAGLTWTNPAGIAGNPTPIFANDLAALEGLGSTGFAARTATDTWAQRSIAVSGSGLSISNGNGVGGNPTISLADDVAAIEALSPSNDDIIQRKAGVWSNRTIAQLLTDLAAAGTTFQPLDSDLTAIAALSTTSFGRSVLTQADASALRTLAGLVIGTNVQAYDADLDAIAALSSTSYGRALLALADAAALRTAAGLGTAATQNTGTSGANVPLLNGINTHSGGDTFTGPTRVQQAMFGLNGAATITVSSDSITPTQARHLLDTEGAASSDNLTTIVNTNTLDGDLLFLSTVNSSRDVVVQHLTGGGNILLLSGTDFTLGTTTSGIVLQRRGGAWYEQFRMTY
jgi:hypothetical protein